MNRLSRYRFRLLHTSAGLFFREVANEIRDQSGPAGLVRCATATAVVAGEVFKENDAVGFALTVFCPVLHPDVFEIIWMVEVAAGQGPYAVGREEFGLVKHTPQELRHAEDAHQRNETAALRPRLVKT